MHPFRATLLLVLSLLFAAPVLADEPADPTWREGRSDGFARARIIGDPTASHPTVLHPISGLHAAAHATSRLGVWAEGTGFSLSRRTSLWNVEGGASWRLDDAVRLTASYRLLNVDLGYDTGPDEGIDITELGISAPFLGLAVDF